MQTFGAAFERRVSKRLELLANVYHYRLDNMITAALVTDVVQQFRNVTIGRSAGFEVEATARLGSRLKVDASLAVQRPSADSGESLDTNSPGRLGKLILETPLFRDRLSLSGGFQYLSQRETIRDNLVPPVYLANLTLASRRLWEGSEVQFGVRNLFNRRYWDPVGFGHGTDRLLEDGCCFFVRLSWGPRWEKTRASVLPGPPARPMEAGHR